MDSLAADAPVSGLGTTDLAATATGAAHQGALDQGRVGRAGLARFNALPLDAAAAELAACCASRRWVAALSLSRPFGSVDALYAAAAEQLTALGWSDVHEALAAHPRIGERAAGTGREAAWSRSEQSGAQDVDGRTAAELAAANAAYETKFGFVFLIRAAGRSAAQMLAAALDRLGHDELTEQAVVRVELGQIVRLRIDKLLAGLAEPAGAGPAEVPS